MTITKWLTEEDMHAEELVSMNREGLSQSRWEIGNAEAYRAGLGEIKGCNYVPAYCYSYIQMWFDFCKEIIERELGWVRDAGINSYTGRIVNISALILPMLGPGTV